MNSNRFVTLVDKLTISENSNLNLGFFQYYGYFSISSLAYDLLTNKYGLFTPNFVRYDNFSWQNPLIDVREDVISEFDFKHVFQGDDFLILFGATSESFYSKVDKYLSKKFQ